MNKIINKFIPIILVTLLSGCFNNSLIFKEYDFNGEFINPKTNIEEDNYYRHENYDSISYVDFYGNNKTINNFRDLYSSSNIAQKFLNAPSVGEVNFLVIPVNFKDSDKTKNEKQLTYIQSAFFGDKSTNTFESVASFYHKSSYGQLKIKGHVSSFYDYPYSSSDILASNSSSISTSRKVAFMAMKWFYENNQEFDYSKFDIDDDKYFDGVYFIYNFPYSSDVNENDGVFWAYTDHSYRGEKINDDAINDQEICISSYAWISIDFLGDKIKPDARTLIHESGHIFGLEDYYNTSSSGLYQPTGFADMMDANIGDHTGLSKMKLNWVTPKVIKEEGEITISPFHSSGDLILIPTSKGYNNTPYDEYLLLEYYEPKGLNKYDAGVKYLYSLNNKQETFTFFSKAGLKVYHVDARLGLFSFKNTSSLIATIDDPNLTEKINEYKKITTRPYCIDFANTNDVPLGKENTKHVLYRYLENISPSKLLKGYAASNDTLFYKGDTFGIETYSDFTFNNGGLLDYTFEIKDMSLNGITIRFNKK